MKRIVIIIYLLITINVNAQYIWDELPLAKLSDSIYIDETEVNVKDWITYLCDLINTDNRIDLTQYLPDTNKVQQECRFYFKPFFNSARINTIINETPTRPQLLYFPQVISADLEEKYFVINNVNIPVSEVPITGITYEQVREYCSWRTSKINSIISQKYWTIPLKFRHKKITARLITPEEFIKYSSLIGFRKKRKITNKDYQKSYSIDSIVPYKNCITFLYKSNNDCNCNKYVENYNYYGPIPVASFFSTFLTVYDWFGNVAEMSSKKGIAKGGSYLHSAKEADPNHNLIYKDAEEWLGFRCILQIE